MMKRVAAIAVFMAAADALVARDTDCCFDLIVGDGGDTVGQIPDGQVRFGGDLPQSQFCISSNGTITDQNGRGCILTRKSILVFIALPVPNSCSTHNATPM